jgi:protein-tyrosine-phosphatase
VRSRALKGYRRDLKTLPPASRKVREYAERLGYNLSQHRAVMVTTQDLRWADLILYMDTGNKERMGEVCTTEDHAKSRCLGHYVGKHRIPDPAFVPRGPELDALLGLVVRAAEACAAEVLGKTKTPRKAGG